MNDNEQKLDIEPANKSATQKHIVQTQSYEGPFPPPALLRQFENILPGAAERIFQFSEREQRHRHEMESKQVEAIATSTKANTIIDIIGRVFGMLFLVITFGVALYFSFIDRSFEFAAMFYSPSIVFALAAIITGRHK